MRRPNVLLALFGLIVLVVLSQIKLLRCSSDWTPKNEAAPVRDRLDSFSQEKRANGASIRDDYNKVADGRNPDDPDCVFRDSLLYRSVYVYPSPGEAEWQGNILSEHGKTRTELYPWQEIDRRTKKNSEYHYRTRDSRAIQYTTELVVREIFINPKSCLRTLDPSKAKLFFVPYMPSLEWHNGTQYPKSFDTSPYGQAILDAIGGKYRGWEERFGWTSEYWKLKQGADHILVMSEPCHGLWHPRSSPGNFVYIHAQKQLAPPIIISKDISKTFVTMYPNCAKKNIVMPHPNTDGRWFNGKVDRMAGMIAQNATFEDSRVRLPNDPDMARYLPQYYRAGNHGMCRALRMSLEAAFECSPTKHYLESKRSVMPKSYNFPHAYRHATFCPCPGGDAPSAKRMFDALWAGCIPVILAEDFVWPFTGEVPGSSELLDPNDFSIRLESSDYRLKDPCGKDRNQTIQALLDAVPTSKIERLRRGVHKAARMYAYYDWSSKLPDNPLKEDVLPTGGGAHALVDALERRAEGQRWPACEEELRMKDITRDGVNTFKC